MKITHEYLLSLGYEEKTEGYEIMLDERLKLLLIEDKGYVPVIIEEGDSHHGASAVHLNRISEALELFALVRVLSRK